MRRRAVFVLMMGIRADVGAGGDKGWDGTEVGGMQVEVGDVENFVDI